MDWLTHVISEHGLGVGIIAVFFGGLLLNLTPCVYPMIPVTIAFFSAQAAGSLKRVVQLAVCYVLGLSLSYALLGTAAAITGALFGSWLQHPVVLVGIALVIVALALSMFGLYELRPPQVLVQRFGSASSGAWGAFLMGLVVGIVAAPCIGPFVLGLLLLISQLGNPAIGFVLLFVLGVGMGLPYLLLGLAAHRVGHLPKAGKWLVWVKRALGIVLLAFALYLVRPLLPQTLWPFSPRAGVAWIPYTEAALTQAKQEQRPVVIDVYADWCLPCVEMDHATFRHPDVVQALTPVATLRVDATREVSPDAERLFERYQVFGAPTVLWFDRDGNERKDLRLTGFANSEEFLHRLGRLLQD